MAIIDISMADIDFWDEIKEEVEVYSSDIKAENQWGNTTSPDPPIMAEAYIRLASSTGTKPSDGKAIQFDENTYKFNFYSPNSEIKEKMKIVRTSKDPAQTLHIFYIRTIGEFQYGFALDKDI